ncbi:hypothetical protein PIROE2DRAFT_15629 [Piromyces sp. E2]|nr:hypothetical protein PIROE2DRAFT_15629 [Piromyces sp. E2]|eukprot:OUM58968.1 hypothetical protein PIROE2DRAFT_15629 [Piromyces sp. E2]
MKLFFISFIFVILCTLHKASCASYEGKDVYFNNDCLWVIIKNIDNQPSKRISNCRYNYVNKEIYCEFIYNYQGILPTLYLPEQVNTNIDLYYRFTIKNTEIEGKCSLKPKERFKSAVLQGYRNNKWENICLIGNMYREFSIHSLSFESPFSTYASKQRFILTTNNGCQIKFYFNKVYVKLVNAVKLDK